MNVNPQEPTAKTEFKEDPLKIYPQAQRMNFLNSVPSFQGNLMPLEIKMQAIFK